MREIILTIGFIIYIMGSVGELFLAILWPFVYMDKNTPIWPCFLIYPIALILIGTQRKALSYFFKKLDNIGI